MSVDMCLGLIRKLHAVTNSMPVRPPHSSVVKYLQQQLPLQRQAHVLSSTAATWSDDVLLQDAVVQSLLADEIFKR